MIQGTYGTKDFLDEARSRIRGINEFLEKVRELKGDHGRKRSETASRYQEAGADLLAALVPEFSASAIARAGGLLGYHQLARDDLPGKMMAERIALEERLASIAANEQFRDRELLLAPGVGKLVRGIAEQEQFRAPMAEVLAKASHPQLDRLVETGYGTPSYDVPWWRLSYYALWEAADFIAERFGVQDFAAIRPEIVQAREAVAEFDRRILDLRRAVRSVEELVKVHSRAQDDLRTVEKRHFEAVRERLRKYLEDSDYRPGGNRLEDDAHVGPLAVRAGGLFAKLTYLDTMEGKQLREKESALLEERQKLERDITKYSRPKKAHCRFPAADFDKRFRVRPDKDRAFLGRYERTYETVYVFDRYEQGRVAEDFLWWDLMTDGRLDGDFIPEVRSFHHDHPDYPYEAGSTSDAHAAAAAIVADQGFEDASLGMLDAS